MLRCASEGDLLELAAKLIALCIRQEGHAVDGSAQGMARVVVLCLSPDPVSLTSLGKLQRAHADIKAAVSIDGRRGVPAVPERRALFRHISEHANGEYRGPPPR